MLDPKFVARLVRDARAAVLDHGEDAENDPQRHRGCLWCYDGRLSHWLSDARAFYRLDDEAVEQVASLYRRAYAVDYQGIM